MQDKLVQTDVQNLQEEINSAELPQDDEIKLSNYSKALLEAVKKIKPRPSPDDLSKLSVSQAVSFLAIAYEKVRNAIEYREDHLVLRAAVERILKRRLALNPEAQGEAENLLRELMWARYFDNESLGDYDINAIQAIIDKYLNLKKQILKGKEKEKQIYLAQFLFDLLTCEIESQLNPDSAQRSSSYTYFIFQTLKDKIKVEALDDEKKDTYLLVAIDRTYRKSDTPYLRYHLFTAFYEQISKLDEPKLEKLTHNILAVFNNIDNTLNNAYVENILKFIKRQLPPFLILFDILNRKGKEALTILSSKQILWKEVERSCNEKYKNVGTRLRNLAFRSLIYIFATKMILALILEYPLSQFFYGEVHKLSIIINTVFPPILMLVIVLFFKLPGDENTKNIYKRIINIVDADKSFETQVALMKKKIASKKSLLVFIFTIIYTITFMITLYLLNRGLSLINFNIISKSIFIFFISVISFFSYRIKQVANEFKLKDKEGIFTPIVDFFFMPILSTGKFFSKELSRLNIFIVVFDFIIEAPFKLVIEIFEEWIKFIRARKEEII